MIDGKERMRLQFLRGKVYDLSLTNEELKPIVKEIDSILDYDLDSWSEDVPF